MGVLLDERPSTSADAATFANLCFEVLWAAPGNSDGDWADISAYVVGGNTGTGRGIDESERFSSGSLSLTLETMQTVGRLFDPDNTTGPFFGLLRPLVQIRVSAVWGGTLYWLWRGYVTSWGQSHVQDKKFVTSITARDGFERLQQAKLSKSPYESRVVALRPNVYYRFDDAGRLTDSSGNARHGFWSRTPSLAAGLLTGDPSKAWAVTVGEPTYARGTHTVDMSLTVWSVDFWFSTTATAGTVVQWRNNNITVMAYLVAGKLRVWNSGTSFYTETTSALNDGATHHVYFDIGPSQYVVDGVTDAGTGSGFTTPAQYTGGLADGEIILGDSASNNDPFVGTLDDLALYGANGVASNYSTGSAPWAGQTTGTRIGAVLDLIGWPATLRDLDTGVSTMQAFNFTVKMSALDAIYEAADTELAETYIDMYQGGILNHRSRTATWSETRSAISQATFGDTASGATIRYLDIDPVRDETLIRNPVVASRNGGATVTVLDQTLIDNAYGDRGWVAPTSYDSSDAVLRDRASVLLQRYEEPATRVRALIFDPTMDPSVLWPQVLGRRIGDRVTVQRKPLGIGSTVSLSQVIQGVSHEFTAMSWRTRFSMAPWDDTTYEIYDDGSLYDDGTVYAY